MLADGTMGRSERGGGWWDRGDLIDLIDGGG
ncbi:MAG: hypothetical protein DVB22_003254 [Verrucomicrobia bacterium]|nr:MAG: hypothetical protein DVB22_003254 [Verrucomicrobiota bacterium]